MADLNIAGLSSPEGFESGSEVGRTELESELGNVYKFLREIVEVDLTNLPEDERSCSICQEPYGSGGEPEHCVQLPCGHRYGALCIFKWLAPNDQADKNTCPMCRAVLFELEGHDSHEDEDLADDARLDRPFDNESIRQLGLLLDNFQHIQDHSIAALTGVPFTQGPSVLNLPPGQLVLITDQVLRIYRDYTFNTAGAILADVEGLSRAIGRLSAHLRPAILEADLPIVWGAQGPRVSMLVDADVRPLIDIALQRLADAEAMWIHHQAGIRLRHNWLFRIRSPEWR